MNLVDASVYSSNDRRRQKSKFLRVAAARGRHDGSIDPRVSVLEMIRKKASSRPHCSVRVILAGFTDQNGLQVSMIVALSLVIWLPKTINIKLCAVQQRGGKTINIKLCTVQQRGGHKSHNTP